MLSGPYGAFTPVKDVLIAGSDAMYDDELLMLENFGLQDSMSAVEIMDPRMDSGMITPSTPISTFDPLMPVLPEEVCWILDQALACEMTWHAGYTLTQTVFTCRYVHRLRELGSFGQRDTWIDDLRRSLIAPAMYAMLKSVDLAWRQLSKGTVIDAGPFLSSFRVAFHAILQTEDWNSEKADVSLMEGVQTDRILQLLEDAIEWLDMTYEMSMSPWTDRIKSRLFLRTALLHLLSEDIHEHPKHLVLAKESLASILSQPQPPTPPPGSHLLSIFDSRINSELPSFLPLPPISCLTIDEMWESLRGLLRGREVLIGLGKSECLIHWRTTALMNSYKSLAPTSSWPPVTRSFAMSLFFTESTILVEKTPSWIVDQFLLEFGNIPHNSFFEYAESLDAILPSAVSPVQLAEDFESDLAKLLVNYHVGCFHNRARQRRNFANAAVHWHRTYDFCQSILRKLSVPKFSPLQRVPLIVQCQHLDVVRELILSGFELEIYAEYELAFLYWYIFGPLNARHEILGELLGLVKSDENRSQTSEEFLMHEADLMKGLSALALAMARIFARRPLKHTIGAAREQLNFQRRFKWALNQEYDSVRSPDPARPDFEGFVMWKEACLEETGWEKHTLHLIREAQGRFQAMIERGDQHGVFQHCQSEWENLVQSLRSLCEDHIAFLQDGTEDICMASLKWNHGGISWFPIPVVEGRNDA